MNNIYPKGGKGVISKVGKREISRLARRKIIVEIATYCFFERGFADTTMSAIAGKLGGSKGTLWKHFCSKEDLFEAVVDARVEALEKQIHDSVAATKVSIATLRVLLLRFTEILLSHDAISLFRLVMAEGGRLPILRRLLYERGPANIRSRTRDYFVQRFDFAEADRLAQLVFAAIVGFRIDALLRPELPSIHETEVYFDNFLSHLKVPEPGFD
jgi:AcrR family transcriptional regulator